MIARRERPLVAGEHDAPDRVVVIERGERGDELVEHLLVERVQHVRPVELNDGDRLVARDDHGLGHAHLPRPVSVPQSVRRRSRKARTSAGIW
jgi:hypothetical protein